jgi:hypothetical protein
MQIFGVSLHVVNKAWFKYTKKDLNLNSSLNKIALMNTLLNTVAARVTPGCHNCAWGQDIQPARGLTRQDGLVIYGGTLQGCSRG